ncbi:Hypothetical protein, putative [Bodo saltans]|uniref:Uncharacterized protein n=1 Tax=Bodo saltans TaxID=75058 RepID=A0A0S4IZT4_BODSA|nr:Hypothetical protein, putative [Bodo saltans]|eukprot:CUG35324.1 Hypothetical protein, putative [Bodo saltans]
MASQEDWDALQRRHVTFEAAATEGKKELQRSRHFEVEDWSTKFVSDETIILMGGESGSGKTMHMLTANREQADVVVYVRGAQHHFAAALDAEATDKNRENVDCNIFVWNQQYRVFFEVLVVLVKAAIRNTNPMLGLCLQGWDVSEKAVFKVRLCLDEIGASTAFIRVCCAARPDALRKLLAWDDRVQLRIIAGGTGVDMKSETLGCETIGSEAPTFKHSIFSARGMSLYWNMRASLDGLTDNEFTDLKVAREKLMGKITWANVEKRKAALKNRDVILQACIKGLSTAIAKSRENDEPQGDNRASQRRLILEGLFSAVESDGGCAAALTNPRLAALIAARCNAVANEMVEKELCMSTSGTNIRQKILRPVEQEFKNINGLKDA